MLQSQFISAYRKAIRSTRRECISPSLYDARRAHYNVVQPCPTLLHAERQSTTFDPRLTVYGSPPISCVFPTSCS